MLWSLAVGGWLVCLLLVCEMVLTLGVECLEIGPRPIYLLENNFSNNLYFEKQNRTLCIKAEGPILA
jgi:hypothetical protein